MSGSSLLIPPGGVLVHLGPFKTGSSASQAALANVRADLPRHGVCYPGRGTRDRRAGWLRGAVRGLGTGARAC